MHEAHWKATFGNGRCGLWEPASCSQQPFYRRV